MIDNMCQSLDGLRGPIATVETLHRLGVVTDVGAGLKRALEILKNKQWPATLFSASTMGDVGELLMSMMNEEARDRIWAGHPFANEQAGDERLRLCLEVMLRNHENVVLIGLSRPAGHWIVGQRVDGRYEFYEPTEQMTRTGLEALTEEPAGDSEQRWVMHRDNVVLFEPVAPGSQESPLPFPVDTPGKEYVSEFLSEYEVHPSRRSLTAAEQRIVQEAIESYVSLDQWLHRQSDASEVVDELEQLLPRFRCRLSLHELRTIGRARSVLRSLSSRLSFREHAYQILRENIAAASLYRNHAADAR